MKHSILTVLLLNFLLQDCFSQSESWTWIQNLNQQNGIQSITFSGKDIWVTKINYVMKIDTLNGSSQAFTDETLPGYTNPDGTVLISTVVANDSQAYINYYGSDNGIFAYDGHSWSNYPCSGFTTGSGAGSKLLQDTQHHLYMAHENSVAEFDGAAWQLYPYTFSNGFDYFNGGVRDSHDTLWLTTGHGELINFKNGIFTSKYKSASGFFDAIIIDPLDHIWIASDQLIDYYKGQVQTINFDPTLDLRRTLMTVDDSERIYFGSWSNQYYTYDGSWHTYSDVPLNNNEEFYEYYNALALDEQNHIAIGTSFGFVQRKENDTWISLNANYTGLPENGIFSVGGDPNYSLNISIGTQDGLALISYSGITYVHDFLDSVLHDKKINYLSKNDGYHFPPIMWIGTNEGIFSWDFQSDWKYYNTSNSSLPNDTVNYILINEDQVWIATNGGVAVLDTKQNSWQVFNTTNSPLPSNHVNCFQQPGYYSDFSILYTGTDSGVAIYDSGKWQPVLTQYNSGLPENDVTSIYPDINGRDVWYGTRNSGIGVHTDNGWQYLNTSGSLLSDSITVIAFDETTRRIIAGTKDHGLQYIQDFALVDSLNEVSGIKFSAVTDFSFVFLGEGFEQWLATNKGVLYTSRFGAVPSVPASLFNLNAYSSGKNLFVNYELKTANATSLSLIDLFGRSRFERNVSSMPGKNSVIISTQQLSPGIYMVQLISGVERSAIKVFIQ